MFDTLKYNRKLIAAGQSKQVADVVMEAFTEMANNNFMTKSDLNELRADFNKLGSDFNEFRVTTQSEFTNVHREFGRVHKEFDNVYKEFDKVYMEFGAIRKEMSQGFNSLRCELDLKLDKLKKEMIIHTGAIQAASVALIVGLIKFL